MSCVQAGHQRAVVSLGFCSPLRMLVSGGYDHEVSLPFPFSPQMRMRSGWMNGWSRGVSYAHPASLPLLNSAPPPGVCPYIYTRAGIRVVAVREHAVAQAGGPRGAHQRGAERGGPARDDHGRLGRRGQDLGPTHIQVSRLFSSKNTQGKEVLGLALRGL